MAEAVVSIALETFRDLLLEEGRLLCGVGDEVKALQMQLKEMKCLLEDADRRRHENKSIANWIAEIRDLAYRAEDVIETYAARLSSRRGRGLKKLLKRFSSILKECYSLHQLGSEISQIKSELERVGRSMQEYGIRCIIEGENSTNDNQLWKRQTPDFQIEDCFVGKEEELKQIVSLVVDDNHNRVVSIWGMGGIGKTTIARKVFNHIDTKRNFQCFAWVCITQQCQIKSVLEDVLKQLNPSIRDVVSSLSNTELVGELCQIQKAKHCLIVLDDLWETDHWDGLKHAFLVEGLKSKILVTTRKQRVAEIGFAVQLGLLSMDSGWELLKKKAFPQSNVPDFVFEEKLLRNIGKEMVHKCGYLPLAISLLGGVLSKRRSMGEWELVKENLNAFLYRGDDIEKEEIHAVLKLSYEDLPYFLKPCFLFMGLYKHDESMAASDLYSKWIAQGMILPKNRGEESLVHVAELYLSELASRSIVQVEVDQDLIPGRKYRQCKLHDVVRELCLSMGKREDFGLQILDYQGGKLCTLMHNSLSRVKTRHLAIHFEREIELAPDRGECAITHAEDTSRYVRSLLLLNDMERKKIEFLESAFDLQTFRLLRILVFVRFIFPGRKLPRGIENLIHLRHLELQECELDELPSSLSKLSYLQTLNLIFSLNIQLPNSFLKKMFRLKDLLLPTYTLYKVGDYPLDLGEGLDDLESLHGFDSKMHQLKSMIGMKNLQSFGARVHNNESLLAIIDAIATKWKKLRFGSVIIQQDCQFTSTEEGLMVFKNVFTCPNLHQLAISIEIGKRLHECRNEVISAKLVRLYLVNSGMKDDPMEILGKLPVLRILHLWPNSFVGEEMTCRASGFPCLKELVLEMLPSLKEWRVEQGAMPVLSEITITYCFHLKMVDVPDGLRFISTLQKLTITGIPGMAQRVSAPDDDNGEGEDFDKVRHVPSIIIKY